MKEAVVRCAFCEGKGGVPANFVRSSQTPCPVCGGAGKVLVEFEKENFVECAMCGGEGGIPPNFRRDAQKPCPSCGGLGVRPLGENWRIVR